MQHDWRTVFEFSAQPILILQNFCQLKFQVLFRQYKQAICHDTNSQHRTRKLLPFLETLNGSNTNMTVFSWSVGPIVTSFISFGVTCILGIALMHIMPYRSAALPGHSPTSPQKQKHYDLFILLIFILNLLFEWLGDKLKFVFSPDVILCGWLGSKHQLTN